MPLIRTRFTPRSRVTPLVGRSGIPVTAVPVPRGGAMSSTAMSSPALTRPQRLSRAPRRAWRSPVGSWARPPTRHWALRPCGPRPSRATS